MKGLSAITTAALLVATTTAFAATSSSASSSTSSSAAASSTKPSTGSSPSASAAASQAGQITAPVPASAEKKWSVDIYAENYVDADSVEHADGVSNTNEFVGLNYTLAPASNLGARKVYIRQNFSAELANKGSAEGAQNFARVGDTELGYSMAKLATWGNEGSLSLTNRLYLPTGVYSQRAGKILTFRPLLVASNPLSKHLELGAVLDPRLYIVTRDSFVSDEGKVTATNDFKSAQYGYVTAKANDDISATVCLGTINALGHHSNNHISTTYLDISASAQLTKALALSLGVDNESDLKGATALLRGSETQYYMNMMASM